MPAAQTRYARSGDVHLAYQVLGDGDRPRDLVIVPDWTSHVEVLQEQPFVTEFLSFLTRFARVLIFDMRGVGLSDRLSSDPVAPEDWMEDVGAVMDAAGSERATLVGHGHAAQLILLFAATHPERVDSVVLINGFARLSRSDDYPVGIPEDVQETVLAGIEASWGTGEMAEILAPSLAGRPGLTEWWGRAERYSASPGTALERMRVIMGLDVRNVLPLVAAPTLVVHNRADRYIRIGHGRYLAEHIPGARLLERKSADHWPLPDADLLGAIEEFVTGSRRQEDIDRFLATVLVVDVVGSTEHASAHGDRHWGAIRDRFEQTVTQALQTYGGKLVDTAGDGVLATFDGPARAIRCASHIRHSVREAGLEVRSGLHAGEVTRRERGIAGIAVHIGARVSALADPGEVLVTRTVRDLVAGSGITFDDRGEHVLKGIPETWALYAATG